MPRYYFDHNATTPVDSHVLDAMLPTLKEVFGNASSIHRFGQDARRLAEVGRQQVASLLKTQPRQIVFTSGGTESDNMAILGTVRPNKAAKRHVITSTIEHPAVLKTCAQLESEGVGVTYISVGASGVVDPDDVRRAMRPETLLVSIMHGNNELGTIQPITEIAAIAHEGGALMHTDGVQSTGKIPTPVEELSLAFIAMSGHKIYAPKGVGALYVAHGVDLEAISYGGKQERGRRSGTDNVSGMVALGAAAELAERNLETEPERLGALRDCLEQGILDSISDCWVNCAGSPRTPNTTSIGFDHVEGEAMVIALDLKGFGLSSGAACSSGAVEPSHVLTAIGLPKNKARSCLRFSLGKKTDGQAVDALLEALPEVVKRLRILSPAHS